MKKTYFVWKGLSTHTALTPSLATAIWLLPPPLVMKWLRPRLPVPPCQSIFLFSSSLPFDTAAISTMSRLLLATSMKPLLWFPSSLSAHCPLSSLQISFLLSLHSWMLLGALSLATSSFLSMHMLSGSHYSSQANDFPVGISRRVTHLS